MLRFLKNWPAWLIGAMIFELDLLLTLLPSGGGLGTAFANPHLAFLLGLATSVAGKLVGMSQAFRPLYTALAQGTWEQMLFFLVAQFFCGALVGQIFHWARPKRSMSTKLKGTLFA